MATRFDLEKLFAALEPQTVNRDAKRDREDVVEVPGMARGMTREALGQAMLLGYGDDIEGYLTSRHPDDIKRERYAFSDEHRVAANAAYGAGLLTGGAVPRILKAMAAAPKQQLDEMPPRVKPDLRQAMRNADQAAPGDESAAQMRAQLEMLLNTKLPPSPEFFPGAFGAQSEGEALAGGGGGNQGGAIPPPSPSDIFALLAGSPQSAVPTRSPEEQALQALSPTDAVKFGQELEQATPVSAEQRAQNLRTTGWDALSATPGPGNLIAAHDSVEGSKRAYDEFSQGNLKRGGIEAAMAALSGVGAVTGLPTSRLARKVAEGASSRLNTFVGPEAKTADKVALEQAEALKKAGADRDEIWKATGWAWDERGLPYFEIDDSAAKLKPPGGTQPQYFDDFLDHPELFKARPDIASHHFSESGRPGSGAYHEPDILNQNGRIDVGPGAPRTRKSVALHEGQHAADNERGASFGANANAPLPADEAAALDRIRGAHGGLYNAERDAKAMLDNAVRYFGAKSPQYDEALERWSTASHALQASVRETGVPGGPGFLAYKFNPGEARARNTEGRAAMNALERREAPPWETLDVDEADILSGRGPSSGPSQVFLPLPGGSRVADDVLDMRQSGRPLRDIYNDTGHFIGPDGSVRREIVDSKMQIKPNAAKAGTETRLGDLVDHPELFEARPKYRDIPVTLTNKVQGENPVARTLEGGRFENSVEGDMRQGIAKNLQYNIAREGQLPASVRHGPDAIPNDITAAIRSLADVPVESHADRKALTAYIESLAGVRGDYLQSMSLVDDSRKFKIEKNTARKSAGNADSRIVNARASFDPERVKDVYPYAMSPPYFQRKPGRGVPPFEEMWTLPPEGASGDDLMEFIRSWHQYGAGRKAGAGK